MPRTPLAMRVVLSPTQRVLLTPVMFRAGLLLTKDPTDNSQKATGNVQTEVTLGAGDTGAAKSGQYLADHR